jgi:hypothetical protein
MIDDKFLVELLYKELEQVRETAGKTSEWVFKTISIGAIPFFILIGYGVANPKYKIAFCAIPFLSIIGILLECILFTHYSFSSSYGKYLMWRINNLIGNKELYGHDYGRIFFGGNDSISIVQWTLFISIVILLSINYFAYPIIEIVLYEYYSTYCGIYKHADFLYGYYWWLVVTFFVMIILPCLYFFSSSNKKAEKLFNKLVNEKADIEIEGKDKA